MTTMRLVLVLAALALAPLADIAVSAQDSTKAQERLLKELQHRSPDRRVDAAKGLGMMQLEAAVPALETALADPSAEVRAAAAAALWRIGPPGAQPAKGALENLLAADSNGKVRVMAAGAVWRLGAKAGDLMPRLRPILDDESPTTAVQAADLLLDLGEAPADVLTAYERAYGSHSAGTRKYAVRMIIEREGYLPEFEPLLIQALRDEDDTVRFYAVAELTVPPEPSAAVVRALEVAAEDSSEMVRVTALEALAELEPSADPADSPAVRELLGDLQSRKADVRANAAVALGNAGAGSPQVVEALIAALGDKKVEVRRAAADALGMLGEPAKVAIPHLRRLFDDPKEDTWVRFDAGSSLADLGVSVDMSVLE